MDNTFLIKAERAIALLLLLNVSILFAQDSALGHIASKVAAAKPGNESFKQVSFFKKQNASLADKNVQQAVSDATFLQLEKDLRDNFLKSAPQAVELVLPYKNGSLAIELVRHEVFTEDFTVVTSASNGEPVPYIPGIFYQGIVKGNENSLATLSVFEDEVVGMVSYSEVGNLVLGLIQEEDNDEDYILYSDRDLLGTFQFDCNADELPMPKVDKTSMGGGPINVEKALPQCVRQFLEADYALFQDKGSVTATVNFLAAVFAEVKTLFNNETQLANLGMYISQVYVWVSQDYYDTNSSSTALNDFQNTRTTFTGDLAHLCALGGNNIGGIAWRPGVCYSNPYGYSNIDNTYQNVPTYSWTVGVLAHELGHNHGAPHTHSCVWGPGRNEPIDCCGFQANQNNCGANCNPIEPAGSTGTIMSYCHLSGWPGIDFNKGFHEQVADTMEYYHNHPTIGFTCLATNCPSYSCDSVTNISVTNIGDDEFTLNWSAVGGASAYNIQHKINEATTWTTENTTGTTFTVKNLSADTTYSAQVQTVCGVNSSAYSTGVVVRTLDACPPLASNTQSSANPVCSGVNFTLSLSQAYSTGYTFQWQSSPTNSGYTNIGGATSSTYMTNQSSSTWYRCEITCPGQSIYSTALQVTIEPNFMNCHCATANTACIFNSGTDYMRIDRIQFINLDNQNNTCSANGYGDYTNGQTVPNLPKGSSQSVSISIFEFAQRQVVFIDFNQDGDFDDSGESTQVPYTQSVTQTGTVAIPSDAVLGNTRMRVRSRNAGDNVWPTNPCTGGWLGESEDYVVNISAALPVELIDFSASLNKKEQVDLKWETATEINTSHFLLERSRNGLDFTAWQKINAAGNSDVKLFYQGLDDRPFYGNNYYRLRMVDLDGTESFSPVRSVSYRPDGFAVMDLFPNPAYETLNLRYQLKEEQKVQFKLTDVTGKIIRHFEKAAIKGENMEEIIINNLPSGIYFISINDGVSEITERFVKY